MTVRPDHSNDGAGAGARGGTLCPDLQHVVALSPEGHDPESTARVRVAGRLKRLLVWSFVAELGVCLSFGAVPAVPLSLQVQALDPADKAANLALVTVLGALAGAIAQPIAGVLSDRTRSRLGRCRCP